MRDFLKEELDYVIENEIDYLKRESDVCPFNKERFMTLLTLETLNNKEKEEIVDKLIADEGLSQTINETIHYYLYHR